VAGTFSHMNTKYHMSNHVSHYSKDKALKQSLLADNNLTLKQINAIAYRHQYAYKKTPNGKLSQSKANKKSYQKLKEDPVKWAAYLARQKVYKQARRQKRLTVTIFRRVNQ